MEVQNTLSVLILVGLGHFHDINFKGVFALLHQINQGVAAFRITAKVEVRRAKLLEASQMKVLVKAIAYSP
ncbi:MAG: hypothetical protein AB9917_24390 [Negativicutes bacterium]